MSAYRDYVTGLSGLQLFLPLDDPGPGVVRSGALAPYATLGVVGSPLRAQTGWADSTSSYADKSTFFNPTGGQSDYFTLTMGDQTFDWTQGYSITVMSTLRNSQNGSSMFSIKFPGINTNAMLFGWDSQYLAPGLVFGVHSLETPAGASVAAGWSTINSTAASATNLLWHVMTVTVTGAGAAKMYVDGVEVASGTLNRRPQNNSKEFFVAKRHDAAGYSGSSFQGKLINLGVFNRVLTPAEITEAQNRSSIFYGIPYAVLGAGVDTEITRFPKTSVLVPDTATMQMRVKMRAPRAQTRLPILGKKVIWSPNQDVVAGGGTGPTTSRPAFGQMWPRGRGR